MRSALLLALAILIAPVSAHAGDLSGKIYDATALPVAGAVVSVGGREVLTDAAGAYAFTGLTAGEHEIAVQLADGAVQLVWAQVGETGTARRNVFLVSAAGVRGMQDFARSAETAPASPVDAPAAEGAAVAWEWRDTEA